MGLASRTNANAPRRPDITRLDELPFPAWDLIDVERYRSIWQQHHGYYSMKHGHDARLPVSLQLVRQTDLGTTLQHPLT